MASGRTMVARAATSGSAGQQAIRITGKPVDPSLRSPAPTGLPSMHLRLVLIEKALHAITFSGGQEFFPRFEVGRELIFPGRHDFGL